MGIVYAGWDATRRRAAVKVLQPGLVGDPAFRARFAREAQLLARVEGPHTARVLAADVDADPAYLALEYVEGLTVHELVENRAPLPERQLRSLAVALAQGLAAVHAVGVVHRDLKPTNVVLSPTGPKLIDFGIAHLPDGTALTSTGLVLGSPGWMAPEQLQAEQTTAASDVFSWAATVAFAATGRSPFGTGRPESVHYRLLHAEPDLHDVPESLRAVVAAALAKNAARRSGPDLPRGPGQPVGVAGSAATGQRTGRQRARTSAAPLALPPGTVSARQQGEAPRLCAAAPPWRMSL